MTKVRKIRDTYSNDVDLAKRSTREKFSFIVSNINLLEIADRTGSHEKFLDSVTDEIENNATLQDWQCARIEKIYELLMRAAGLPYVPEHQDRRRKGLRYG